MAFEGDVAAAAAVAGEAKGLWYSLNSFIEATQLLRLCLAAAVAATLLLTFC